VNRISFFKRLFYAPISRLAAVTLILLACSIPGFSGDIHEAVKAGDLAKVKALLKDNPGLVSRKDDNGSTPLYLTVQWGNKDMAELLLANGADINAKSGCISLKPFVAETPLHEAAMNGRKDMVEFLLAHGADVNAKDIGGYAPLHQASWAAHNAIVEFLLAKGADVNAKTIMGMTPLDMAVANCREDVAELLRQRGGIAGVEGLYIVGNGVKSPEVIAQAYPCLEKARKARIFDGEILLQAIVHKDGTVDSIKVIKGLGYGIDEEAVNTISSKWRFKPGTLNGDPVDVITDIKFTFHMD
jgi:TonB family protein